MHHRDVDVPFMVSVTIPPESLSTLRIFLLLFFFKFFKILLQLHQRPEPPCHPSWSEPPSRAAVSQSSTHRETHPPVLPNALSSSLSSVTDALAPFYSPSSPPPSQTNGSALDYRLVWRCSHCNVHPVVGVGTSAIVFMLYMHQKWLHFRLTILDCKCQMRMVVYHNVALCDSTISTKRLGEAPAPDWPPVQEKRP